MAPSGAAVEVVAAGAGVEDVGGVGVVKVGAWHDGWVHYVQTRNSGVAHEPALGEMWAQQHKDAVVSTENVSRRYYDRTVVSGGVVQRRQ